MFNIFVVHCQKKKRRKSIVIFLGFIKILEIAFGNNKVTEGVHSNGGVRWKAILLTHCFLQVRLLNFAYFVCLKCCTIFQFLFLILQWQVFVSTLIKKKEKFDIDKLPLYPQKIYQRTCPAYLSKLSPLWINKHFQDSELGFQIWWWC